jgi:cytoskeletal protein CcmA (bactofilin family)
MSVHENVAASGKDSVVTILGLQTEFVGTLRFREALRLRGKFRGTVDATGALYVDKGAVVEADMVSVTSLTVAGTVIGSVVALDRVEMLPGAVVKGDIATMKLRIADGVLFEGQCRMTGVSDDVEIFSRPSEEIKNDLRRVGP